MNMMKNKIFQASIVALASLAVVSCDDYNDQFGINYKATDTRSSAFTLASTDYEAIANNEENKAIAARLDQEAGTGTTYADALAALATDKYFTTLASPELYLPAFLKSSTNYLLADEGARYSITLNFYRDPSGYLAELTNIGSYDFTADDYKSVWGDAANASYLTPATLSQIPGVLNNSVSGAQEGDMMVVNYAYSALEPSTGGGSDEPVYTPIADVVANTGGGNYTVKGTVIATYNSGFLLGDETGSILVYLYELNYSVGDVVTVSGTTSAYGGLMQFPGSSEVTLLERAETFSYPTPASMDGAAMDAYLTAPEIKYVSYTGTLSIDEEKGYYNVAVDGASSATASLQYPVVGVVDSSLDGQEVTVTGYLIGTSGSPAKYVNTMVTTVAPADGSGEEYTPVGLLAYDSEGTQRSVRGVVAATYERGFLLTDGSGNILVYKSDTGAAVGDIMTVSGKLGEHNGFPQFTNDATVTKVGTGEFELPTPRQLDAESMVAYLSNPYIGLVTYEGVLTIDGNYKNVAIDGTADVEGSLSYITVDEALNGQHVKVVGYAIGASSGRFFNTMVTSIEPVGGADAAMRAIGNVSTSEANSSALYRFDGNAWSLYTTDAASIMPLDPAAYAQYGSSSVAVNAIDDVAAVFLMQKLPFAQDGALAAVIYNTGDDLAVKEYMLSKGAWIPTPEYDVKTYLFEYLPEGWTRATTYFNEPLLDGATGGFEIKNVTTDGLSYVWKIDSSYGWKASAYVGGANHPTESWIVSPQIDLRDAAAPVLQFETALNFWDGYAPTDFCTVLITTDYIGEIEGTTWEELEVTGWPTKSSWDFVTVKPVDLSAYVGKVVNIAFRYKSTADVAPTWEVKNVKVGEPE